GQPASRIAIWDGSHWSALGEGMNSSVGALAIYDDGSGPALYAGGTFVRAGNTGLGRGGRSVLYACGNFFNAGGINTRGIAMWNGTQWHAVGGGLVGYAFALHTFTDS